MISISIAKDYSEYPGLRHCTVSDFSGEDFYHKILNQAFKEAFSKKEKISIILDGTTGYASSFLDEAFGNLVYDFTLENVKRYVDIISNEEPHWKDMIENQTYNQWEKRRTNKEAPLVTILHKEWYRISNNIIENSIWEQPAV